MSTIMILKALADENRLEIVRHLASQAKPCGSKEVVPSCSAVLALSQPTFSHHMKQLVAADIVSEEKTGKSKLYSLNRKRLNQIGINVDKI